VTSIDKGSREVLRDAVTDGDDDQVIAILRESIGQRRWVSLLSRKPTYVDNDGDMGDTWTHKIQLPVPVRVCKLYMHGSNDGISIVSLTVKGQETMLTDVPLSCTIFAHAGGEAWNIERIPAGDVIETTFRTVDDSSFSAAILVEILGPE
jgi:hypothetical protein